MTDDNTNEETDATDAKTEEVADNPTLTLDDMFNDSKEDEDADAGIPATEDSDADEAKGEEDAETPAAEDDEGVSVPLTALKDERQKRQSAEEELTTTRQKLAKFEQKAGDVPDPDADPKGFKVFFEDQANENRINDRISTSAEIVKDTKEDYDQMESLFLDMANKEPKLAERMRASKNPALFAYKTAKAQSDVFEAAKVKETEELKASIRADLMKELGIKPEPSKAEKQKKSALEVPNLTGTTAKGSNSTPVLVFKHDSDEMFSDSPYG